jgi:spore maturation protein CgeB
VPADRIKNHESFANSIYNLVESFKPDMVFSYVNNRHAIAEPFLKIRNHLNIPTINMYLDDINKFNLIKSLAHAFTLNLTCTKYALPWYEQCDAKALYLPEGVNPNSYVCQNIEDSQKDVDIAFVGSRYGNRSEAIQALKAEGFRVKVHGKKWEHGKILFEQMIDLYNRSKIVVGFSRSISQFGIKSIKGRDFEATMCGAFYLCEHNPELCDCFEHNKEIVFWEDIPDLIKKAHYYLNNVEQRIKIAKASYDRSQAEHTCIRRIEHLFKYLAEQFNL